MSKYRATSLITAAFDEAKIKYSVRCDNGGKGREWVDAIFPIDGGPAVTVHFFSTDDGNDVAVRILPLLHKVPEEKMDRMLKACNRLNEKLRYVKFSIDDDGDVNLGYDFPVELNTDCVGPVAVEMLVRIMRIMDDNYGELMKVLYTDEDSDEEDRMMKLRMLEAAIERMREVKEQPSDADSVEKDAEADPEGLDELFRLEDPDEPKDEEAV